MSAKLLTIRQRLVLSQDSWLVDTRCQLLVTGLGKSLHAWWTKLRAETSLAWMQLITSFPALNLYSQIQLWTTSKKLDEHVEVLATSQTQGSLRCLHLRPPSQPTRVITLSCLAKPPNTSLRCTRRLLKARKRWTSLSRTWTTCRRRLLQRTRLALSKTSSTWTSSI